MVLLPTRDSSIVHTCTAVFRPLLELIRMTNIMDTGNMYRNRPSHHDAATAAAREQVTAVGVRALLESLRLSDASGDRLSCLELDFNPIGDAGAQPLPAYLKERAARGGGGLEELSLRFCGIGPAGCRYSSTCGFFFLWACFLGFGV